MKKCNSRKKMTFIVAGIIVVMSILIVSCHKIGLYQQLPNATAVVEDPQNAKNIVGSVVIRNAQGDIIPYYYLNQSNVLGKSITTPSSVVDSLYISLPPNTDVSTLKIIPQFLKTSMNPTSIVDTHAIRIFQTLSTPITKTINNLSHTYTMVDTTGVSITFSNGYQRRYQIFIEPLEYVPPRIYNLGSYTGGLDSIVYDDVNLKITIYRSPLNMAMGQTLGYSIQPANAVIAPTYISGSVFDFASAVATIAPAVTIGKASFGATTNKTINVPVSVPTASGGTHTVNYEINLHLGIYKFTPIYSKMGTSRDNTNFSMSETSSVGNYDKEMSIAVNNKYVFVLKLNSNLPSGGTVGAQINHTLFTSSQIFAYSLTDTSAAPIALSMPAKTGLMGDSMPPICDIAINGNTLIGMGYTQRPNGTSATNIPKIFFISWNINNLGAGYVLGDSLSVGFQANTGAFYVPPNGNAITKMSIEGDMTTGAQWYAFYPNYLIQTAPAPLLPAGKRALLKLDANGAVRIVPSGAGLDTASHYYNDTWYTAPGGGQGRIYYATIPASEGGGALMNNGSNLLQVKSIDQVPTIYNPPATSIVKIGATTGQKVTSVFPTGPTSDEAVGMVYFKYGNVNYFAGFDWYRSGSTNAATGGLDIYRLGKTDIGTQNVLSEYGTGLVSDMTMQNMRVAKYNSGVAAPGVNVQYRGDISKYIMPNGKVRIAILIPGIGFGVYDIQ